MEKDLGSSRIPYSVPRLSDVIKKSGIIINGRHLYLHFAATLLSWIHSQRCTFLEGENLAVADTRTLEETDPIMTCFSSCLHRISVEAEKIEY